MKRLATVLAALGGAFIIYVGLLYLFTPQRAASGFGLPSWPQHEGTGFLTVKGGRDISFGLITFALLLTGNRKALGWATLAMAVSPLTDMLTVLSNHGSTATAFGVHGLTAATVALTALLLLRERPTPADA
ncbi:DUF4267 domain-containing protein [Kitasatospora sp. NPDC006697]|uniref:DUF4267 domain-containing protein n=1 Tax=Kitasatospora sp. NPDC006697 TaxID=3364020 RepID=UPI0036AB5C4B